MDTLHQLIGEIDSNDFETVKTLLDAFKSKKKAEGKSNLSAIDENVPLAEAFCSELEMSSEPTTKCQNEEAIPHSTKPIVTEKEDTLRKNEKSSEKPKGGKTPVKNPIAIHGLSSFGFQSNAMKNTTENKNKLFSMFVQDRRIAPSRIRYWEALDSKVELPTGMDDTQGMKSEGIPPNQAIVDPFFHEEESSLMHSALFHTPQSKSIKAKTFGDFIELSNDASPIPADSAVQRCPCSFHSTQVPYYYENFDNEIIFSGFYAIGYDPCQSRPPYFGSYNQFTNEKVTENELLHLGRFSTAEDLPRFSTLDYDYDSGDDWDVLEGDEEIGSSASNSLDDDGSLSSSDMDFINDEIDDSDSDNELQRNIIEARRNRMNCLRGKEKLIPSFSGPFTGLLPKDHPLQNYDRLETFTPLSDDDFYNEMLGEEVKMHSGKDVSAFTTGKKLSDAEVEAALQQTIQEAALKNRRDMTPEEIEALHIAVKANSKTTAKTLMEALRAQHLCVGVAYAQMARTVKQYYERTHGMLVRRTEPWKATDERLFKGSRRLTDSNEEESKDDLLSPTTSPHVASETACEQEEEKEMPGPTKSIFDSSCDPSVATRAPSKRSRSPES